MNVAGIPLKNPLILCSGVLGISSALFARLEKAGMGGIVTKSISLRPTEGYPPPTVVPVAGGVLNAMGLPNPGVDAFLEEMGEASLSIPLIISVFGTDAKEVAAMVDRVSPYCDAVELNLSCPHAGGLLAIGQNPGLVRSVVASAARAATVPVVAKLTPNVTDITEIGKAAEEGGADAVSAINTVRGMAIDIHQAYPVLSNVSGGLSGPAVKPIGVKCVWDLAGAIEIPIIGIGGISSGGDVVEYLMAGASAVELGTCLGSGGIEQVTAIRDGLDAWCSARHTTYEALSRSVRDKF